MIGVVLCIVIVGYGVLVHPVVRVVSRLWRFKAYQRRASRSAIGDAVAARIKLRWLDGKGPTVGTERNRDAVI